MSTGGLCKQTNRASLERQERLLWVNRLWVVITDSLTWITSPSPELSGLVVLGSSNVLGF